MVKKIQNVPPECGRILYHDPNPAGSTIVPLENLSIDVNLEVSKKSRSIITSGNDSTFSSSSSGTNGKISFLDGSPYGSEGKRALTTSYTNIGTTFNTSGDADMEGFGMTDIQIEFDTSYTPMIKIKFVDIRGGMLSRQSTAPDLNRYNLFFDLPYPMFSLTVNGYYGKAVTYCLHLIRWNASFNTETGNFEIDAEFIGYTYAILTDMLMGYLKAVPKTAIGSIKYKKLADEYKDSGIPVYTIDEMLYNISKLNDNLNEFKSTNEDYGKIVAIGESIAVVKEMKEAIENLFFRISINREKLAGDDTYQVYSEDLQYRDLGPPVSTDAVLTEEDVNNLKANNEATKKQSDSIREVDKIIDDYNVTIEDLVDKLLAIKNSGNPDPELFKIIHTFPISYDDISNEPTSGSTSAKEPLDVFLKNDKYVDPTERKRANEIRVKMLNKIRTIKSKEDLTYQVLDAYRAVLEINRLIDFYCDEQKRLEASLSEKVRKFVDDGLEFKPTIKSLVRTLTMHCEVLLETIMEVSHKAEGSDIRRTELIEKLGIENLDVKVPPKPAKTKDNKGTDAPIYPFPMYNDENGDEKWIGDEVEKGTVDEVDFTIDLLDALIQSKEFDIKLEALTNSGKVDWFALTPLDTKGRLLGGLALNPYKNPEPIHPDETMRILMYRMFLYLGVGNTKVDDELLTYIAKFEAHNLFDGVNTKTGEMRKLLNASYNSGSDIITHFLKGSDNIKNRNGYNSAQAYMFGSDGDYVYSYITETASVIDRRAYIPVSDGWSGERFYNGNELKNENDLALLGAGDNRLTFIGNYINGTTGTTKPYDGAQYLKILGANNYSTTPFTKPTTLTPKLYKSYTEKYTPVTIRPTQNSIVNSLEDDKAIKNLNPISGKFGTTEFFEINADNSISGDGNISELTKLSNGNTKTTPLFYVDCNRGSILGSGSKAKTIEGLTRIGENKALVNEGILGSPKELVVPRVELGWVDRTVGSQNVVYASLFGVPLYYAQIAAKDDVVDLAKAYLFVNTFPLAGTKNNDEEVRHQPLDTIFGDSHEDMDTINALFSSNAGFIKSPTLWCYWMGSVLWRRRYFEVNGVDPIVTSGVSSNQSINLIPLVTTYPKTDELFFAITSLNTDKRTPMLLAGDSPSSQEAAIYEKVDSTVLKLPEQVKDEFINLFTNWVEKEFKELTENLEMSAGIGVTKVSDGVANITNWETILTFNYQTYSGDTEGVIPQTELTSTERKNYSEVVVAAATYTGNPVIYKPYFYQLTNGFNTKANKYLVQLMLQESVIANYSPNTFRKSELGYTNANIRIPTSTVDTYLDVLWEEYKKLYKENEESIKDKKKTKDAIFKSVDNDVILLNIYRYLSSLNNKWVGEYTPDDNRLFFPCTPQSSNDDVIAEGENRTRTRLIDSFRFLNKSFTSIGDEFLINPRIIYDMITSNYNQSFFDYINRILADNNFNFIPLPSYVDFKDGASVAEIFEPIPFNQVVSNIGPTFLCVYIGQPSTHLDLGKASAYADDGLDLRCEQARKSGDWTIEPDLAKGEKYVPVFEVNYAQQNQSYFKNIKLDQREFTETEESLVIIDELSKSGDKNKAASVGQNLFNIYQTRAYSAEVEAMGMPLIQPMMYFQLNNIPMFHGAYMIIKTSHHITPNHMDSKFTGIRIRDVNTPLYKSSFQIMSLISDAETCDTKLKYKIKGEEQYEDVVKDDKVTPDPTPIVDMDGVSDYYKHGYTVGYNFKLSDYDAQSNTKKNGVYMTYNEIINEVNDITNVPINTLKLMMLCESTIGTNKDGKGNKTTTFTYEGSSVTLPKDMNGGGYVGLMQFGKLATLDVRSNVQDAVFIPNNGLEFYANTDAANNKIIFPSDWNGNSSTNNKFTNSLFDDYINVMAGAYYAIQNMGITPEKITNTKDVYLSHQQGRGGLNTIKKNPLDQVDENSGRIPTNMKGNKPPLKDVSELTNGTLTNGDWYAAWAGRIDSAAVELDNNYVSNVNDKYPNANKFRRVLNQLGYSEKGSSLTEAGDISENIEKVASSVMKKIKELHPNLVIIVTAGNDNLHSNSQYSRHAAHPPTTTKGNAIDFTVMNSNGTKIVAINSPYRKLQTTQPPLENEYNSDDRIKLTQVLKILQGFTAGGIPDVGYLDEYTLGSETATGPHFHLSYFKGGGSEGVEEREEAYALADTNDITEYTV